MPPSCDGYDGATRLDPVLFKQSILFHRFDKFLNHMSILSHGDTIFQYRPYSFYQSREVFATFGVSNG